MKRPNRLSTNLFASNAFQGDAISAKEPEEPLLKRPLDIILSTLMIMLSLPVSLAIALAIKLEDGGPIFYRQERWERYGSRFRSYKF